MSDLRGKTVAVTGARGRVGRLLVEDLSKTGCHVREIDALPNPNDGSDYVQVDLGSPDEAALRRAVEGVDAAVHLAALMSWDERRASDLYRINTAGTLALLAALY